jgi:aspartyl-tRNA(Asn)/glutamyl-tRNA(Gln) amidotransferase subunit C
MTINANPIPNKTNPNMSRARRAQSWLSGGRGSMGGRYPVLGTEYGASPPDAANERAAGTITSMPVEIDIERVAHLARIALTDEELAAYSDQLVHILEHAERVQALPTEGVEPTSHPLPMVNAFRPDEVTPSLSRDDALAGAPDAEDGYFRVPKILDES